MLGLCSQYPKRGIPDRGFQRSWIINHQEESGGALLFCCCCSFCREVNPIFKSGVFGGGTFNHRRIPLGIPVKDLFLTVFWCHFGSAAESGTVQQPPEARIFCPFRSLSGRICTKEGAGATKKLSLQHPKWVANRAGI